jgi:hypothetical protein
MMTSRSLSQLVVNFIADCRRHTAMNLTELTDQSGSKPLGSRGGSSCVDRLHAGQGAPTAPPAHACGPVHG